MATDLAVGQLASSTGIAVGNAVYAASLILGEINDGSVDYIGQAFLPESLNGETLDTPEKAQQVLVTFTQKQIETIAADNDWEFQCVYGCDTWNQIFTLIPKKPLSEMYIYRPESIIVKTIITLPEAVEPQDPISAMVGFPVKWKTKQGNYYIVDFFSEPIFDEDMKMMLHEHKEYPHTYPGVKRDLASTRIGRELKSQFHSTPCTLHGNQDMYPKLLIKTATSATFVVMI